MGPTKVPLWRYLIGMILKAENFIYIICIIHYFIAVKRYRCQGNSYKGKHFIGDWLTVSEIWSIIMTAGSMTADMVLEKLLRVLHLDPQAVGKGVTLGLA